MKTWKKSGLRRIKPMSLSAWDSSFLYGNQERGLKSAQWSVPGGTSGKAGWWRFPSCKLFIFLSITNKYKIQIQESAKSLILKCRAEQHPKLGIWPRLDRNMASLNVAHSHSILPSIIPKCVSVFSVRMEESILSLIFHGCETIVLLRAMKLGLSKRNNSKEQSVFII